MWVAAVLVQKFFCYYMALKAHNELKGNSQLGYSEKNLSTAVEKGITKSLLLLGLND